MPTEQPQSESSYVIDAESGAETARLMDQDMLLTQHLGGFFPVALNTASIAHILDIACGPGGWVLGVAHAYPKTQVIGVDISPTLVGYPKAQARVQGLDNATFRVMDVLHPLGFDDH